MTMLAVIPASGGATGRGRSPRGFPLFTAFNVALDGNRVWCNINAVGEQCRDSGSFSTSSGGVWPGPNGVAYVFNGGLAVAAIVGGGDLPNYPWPGDTVGAFFHDPRGDQEHSQSLAGIYSSRNARDRVTWPAAARVLDPQLFDTSLLGRSISSHDTWVRYWDGDPRFTNGRDHSAGLLVEQRTLQFTSFSLEDIIFYVTG